MRYVVSYRLALTISDIMCNSTIRVYRVHLIYYLSLSNFYALFKSIYSYY